MEGCHRPDKTVEAGREGVNQTLGSNWNRACAAGSDGPAGSNELIALGWSLCKGHAAEGAFGEVVLFVVTDLGETVLHFFSESCRCFQKRCCFCSESLPSLRCWSLSSVASPYGAAVPSCKGRLTALGDRPWEWSHARDQLR